MKKRLRKKKHLGEFQQMGFIVELHFPPDVSVADWMRITDEFVLHAIEANNLEIGGGGAACRKWGGFVTRDHRYQSTNNDRIIYEDRETQSST